MKRIFLKVFTLLLFSSFAIAQESPRQPQQQEQRQNGDQDNFFDTMETAPVTYKGAFTKMMLTLLGLIILIVISVWLLRRISHGRMKQMNYGRDIKILERRPLSAKSILYLVEISGKKVVIAESQIEVRAITTADHLSPEES